MLSAGAELLAQSTAAREKTPQTGASHRTPGWVVPRRTRHASVAALSLMAHAR